MNDLCIYLGNKNYSSWSLRAWLPLKQTGVPFREVIIPLSQANSREQLRAHSPSGRVPALTHGELTIWESLAIAEYLAETLPAAQLWPAAPATSLPVPDGAGGAPNPTYGDFHNNIAR